MLLGVKVGKGFIVDIKCLISKISKEYVVHYAVMHQVLPKFLGASSQPWVHKLLLLLVYALSA
jgi:hypothetical protein